MTEIERNQIKDALFKCAEENENRSTFTGHIVVSSLCKSAVERIEELEKENAELKEQCLILADCNTCHSTCKNENLEMKKQLTKAKEYIKLLLMNCVGVYESTGKTIAEIQIEAEQFIKE